MIYQHIGWCHEDNHDKVWGVILLSKGRGSPWYEPNKFLSFWGRRGAKLQTKMFEGSDWTAEKMFRKKLDRGYQEVDKNRLDQVYPEFETDLEKTAIWAALRG